MWQRTRTSSGRSTLGLKDTGWFHAQGTGRTTTEADYFLSRTYKRELVFETQFCAASS